MPQLKLTKYEISKLPYSPHRQIIYRDTQLRGFGLRVSRQTKTFIAEGQVRGRTVRATIGRSELVPIEAARRKAIELLADMADGIDPNRTQLAKLPTVSESFAQFFETKRGLAMSTRSGYQRTCDVYLQDWSRLLINEVTRQMVLAKHRHITRHHGAVTANNVFRHFRSIYNFTAALFEELPPNPVIVLTQGRVWHRETRRRTLIASHQLPQWWQAVWKETEDARDVLLLALFTGMRRSEIIALQWETVDLVGKLLRLPKTKNGDPLELPLSQHVTELLDNRRNRVGQSEWVFPSRSKAGHIVETKTFTRRVSAASGVTFTMHDLRRTFITIAESLDIPAYALKRLLNHRADSDITGGYIVINAERLREPVERIATRILELANADKKARTA